MSYTIVYDRQVIFTPLGYTVLLLMGDNNVYETNKKRARDWTVVNLNQTKGEILDFHRKYCGGNNEHFMFRGKFLNDDEMMRFFEAGIDKAMIIEEFCKHSFCTPRCSVIINNNTIPWGERGHTTETLLSEIKTTAEYCEWNKKAENLMNKLPPNQSGEIRIRFFLNEPLRIKKEKPLGSIKGDCYLKCGKFFVTGINGDLEVTSGSTSVKEALVFTPEKVKEILNERKYGLSKPIKVMSKEKVDKTLADRVYVIKYNKGSGYSEDRCYVEKSVKHYIKLTYQKYAKKYTSSEGNAAIKRLQKRMFNGSFELVKVGDT